jgi:hypothetical protein
MVCCSWNYKVSELHLSSHILKKHSADWVSFYLQVQQWEGTYSWAC